MDINEYKEKHFLGFWGNDYYEGVYADKNYVALIKDYSIIVLLSRAPLSEKSIKYRNGYETHFAINELDDFLQCKMYALYRENEYEVK